MAQSTVFHCTVCSHHQGQFTTACALFLVFDFYALDYYSDSVFCFGFVCLFGLFSGINLISTFCLSDVISLNFLSSVNLYFSNCRQSLNNFR